MNMNRRMKGRVAQSSALTLAAVAMAGGLVLNGPVLNVQASATAGIVSVADADLNDQSAGHFAGVISSLNTISVEAMSTASVAEEQVAEVSSSENTETVVDSEWADRLMANVEDELSVRASASTDAELVGKLRKGDVATIVSTEDGWYQITSGNVTGYVSADYVVTGEAAKTLASEVCTTYATSTTGGLRVRSAASEDTSILTALGEGDQAVVDTTAEAVDGWVAVTVDDATGYVKADYVTVETEYGSAITMEEEQAEKEAAAKAAAEAAAAESSSSSSQTTSTTTTQNAAVAASYDEVTLLAALIQCEAGSESYEGQVAVGAVVMNRVRSGSYPSSIYNVIYQSGQFTPASTGAVASTAASGPSATAISAAQAAISGTDNTGGATSFRRASTGISGVVIGNHVFY